VGKPVSGCLIRPKGDAKPGGKPTGMPGLLALDVISELDGECADATMQEEAGGMMGNGGGDDDLGDEAALLEAVVVGLIIIGDVAMITCGGSTRLRGDDLARSCCGKGSFKSDAKLVICPCSGDVCLFRCGSSLSRSVKPYN
jgi:hypothetical protein